MHRAMRRLLARTTEIPEFGNLPTWLPIAVTSLMTAAPGARPSNRETNMAKACRFSNFIFSTTEHRVTSSYSCLRLKICFPSQACRQLKIAHRSGNLSNHHEV